MAITFDWYENPTPADKEDEKKTLHPRPVSYTHLRAHET